MIKAIIAALMLGAGPAPSIDIPPPGEVPAKQQVKDVAAERQAVLREVVAGTLGRMTRAGLKVKTESLLFSTRFESSVGLWTFVVDGKKVAMIFMFENDEWTVAPDLLTADGKE